jgi:hypothetical protein
LEEVCKGTSDGQVGQTTWEQAGNAGVSRSGGGGLPHFLNRPVSAPVNESMAVAHAPTNRRPTRKKGKKKGMCAMPGCLRQSVYGPLPPAPPPERDPPTSHLGMARPTFCGRHKNSSHVDLRNPRCVFPNCLSRSVYGPPPRLSSRLPSSTLALSSGKYFSASILLFFFCTSVPDISETLVCRAVCLPARSRSVAITYIFQVL